MRFTTLCGGLCQTAPRSSQFYEKVQYDTPVPPDQKLQKDCVLLFKLPKIKTE